MARSEDLRERVVKAVLVDGGALVKHFETTGDVSPRPSGSDRRYGRFETHHDYLMGLFAACGYEQPDRIPL